MMSRDMSKYAAMRPYFEVVAEGLKGLVDGSDFFDMHAEDVVVEYIITVPDYPRRVVGRDALAELYSDYGDSIVQSGSSDVHRHYDPAKSVMVLEYTMHGTVVHTGAPYANRFISVIGVKDRKIVHWRDYLDPLAVFAAFSTTPANSPDTISGRAPCPHVAADQGHGCGLCQCGVVGRYGWCGSLE